MSRSFDELRSEILALDADAKESLLADLIAELDRPFDDDVQRAWLLEAHRRLRQVERGEAELIPADQVFEQIRQRLNAE